MEMFSWMEIHMWGKQGWRTWHGNPQFIRILISLVFVVNISNQIHFRFFFANDSHKLE